MPTTQRLTHLLLITSLLVLSGLAPVAAKAEDEDEAPGHPLLASRKVHFSVYYTNRHIQPDRFNNEFVGYDLNQLQHFTHQPINRYEGFGFSFGGFSPKKFSFNITVEYLYRTIVDRQSRTFTYHDTGNTETLVGEHTIDFGSMSFLIDVQRLFDLKFAVLGVGAGVEIQEGYLDITYRINDVLIQEYGTDSNEGEYSSGYYPYGNTQAPKNNSLAFAARLMASLHVVVAGPVMLNMEGGYRFAEPIRLKMHDSAWSWETPTGPRRATIETSGPYLRIGLGVYFKP